jgi:outer membrane protein assembly factor BamA
MLRDKGYFYFSPEFVYFQIDSAFKSRRLDIYLNIEQTQVPVNNDSVVYQEKDHKKYLINKFVINPNFNPLKSDTAGIKVLINPIVENGINRYQFNYNDKLKIRPRAIRNSILMEPLQIYRQSDEKNTYKQLSGLPLFGYTSIHFKEITDKNSTPDSLRNYLDCSINLVRRPVQSFSVETEGTTSGGKLGMNGNFVYQNLNIFRGAEVLTFKLTGGVEWQQGGVAKKNNVLLFFNTFETGAEVSLDFPKFLLPVSQDRIPKLLRPRTTIKTGTNFQNRPDYKRYVTNISFGYNWQSQEFVGHSLTPVEINSVSIFPDSAFIHKINALNDPRLKNQYTDHFIMAIKYSYLFNNQVRNKVKNFTFFRWNFESAGNLLGLSNSILNTPKNENGQYTVWNIPYSQYLRSDIDFRYFFTFSEENTLVYRNLFGLGVPIGNSVVLPFEKGFYGGGTNDMRGWKYRSLGPGSYQDTSTIYFEKMGDIILEANLEYRFPVYGFLKGALFTDFGNIWLLNNSESYPGGKLNFDEILNEIAIDGGIGFRFDFSFFIFRIDGAAPLRDPALPKGSRWQFSSLQMKDVIWNFGIGYPF